MKRTFLSAALLLMGALSASAQQQGIIEHTPQPCIRAGEMAMLHVTVHQEGVLQMYFRRTGNTDWCMVEGQNKGPLSTVIAPKFETGDQIEYYFLLVQGKRVVEKSPKIYMVKNTMNCEMPFARHAVLVTMQCLPPGGSPMASSIGAGYAITSAPPPDDRSPSTPFAFTAP